MESTQQRRPAPSRRFAARRWEPEISGEAADFVAQTLRTEGDRIAHEIVDAIKAQVEEAAGFPPEVMLELVRGEHARAIAALGGHRQPTAEELAVSAATAAELARSGIPVEAVLLTRRIALRRCCELVQETGAAAGLEPQLQVECIYRLWEWADAIQVAEAEAHRLAAATIAGTGDQERALFIRALLHGTLAPSEVSGRASAYGLLPGARYYACRARPAAGVDIGTLAEAIETTGSEEGVGVLMATIGGDLYGVIARPPQIDGEGVVGLGTQTELGQLSSSFELATRALETALAFSYDGVVSMDDLSLRPAIMTEAHLGERMVDRYVEPLLELGEFGTTLEETMREYFAHGMRIEESAKALFVHPNTLRHRLDRFQQLTGADLRNTEDVLEVWWALERRSLDARGLTASRADRG